MVKTELKKDLRQLYNPPSSEVSIVKVPPMSYLMIHGMGDPNTSQEYMESIEALHACHMLLNSL